MKLLPNNLSLLRRLHGDQAGQVTLEWALILVVVVLPSFYLMRIFLGLLVDHWQMVTFLETLPFP